MKKILATAFGLGFLVFGGHVSFAVIEPTLHIIGPEETLGIGAEFDLKIVLDTENPVNAYQVAMSFDPEILEVINTNDAASIIDIMRDQPKVYEDGRVTFSGASLNPFVGGDGLLLTLNMRVKEEGVGNFTFQDSFVYLANGKGTKVRIVSGGGRVEAQEGVAAQKEAKIVDEAPPSVLNLSITNDPINPDQKLLGFLVKDNSTGVKQTYLQYRQWLRWSEPLVAQNPTALPKNAWAVKFQAIDNTGNIIEKVVYDWKAFIYYDLLILILALLAIGIVLNRTFRKKRV